MARLIDADKITEQLLRFADRLVEWNRPEAAEAIRTAVKVIRREKTAWIPVNERKPQEFVSVLIYAPGEIPLPAVHEAYFARGCWVTHITVLPENEVTHWMEMPAGPEK